MSTEQFKKDILPLQDKMYRYALSMVFDLSLAQDIVQEVFLKLWATRTQLAKVKNKEAWCIRITRNLCLDKLKRVGRHHLDLEQASELPTFTPDPEQTSEDNDLLAAIYRAMEDLSAEQREIFRLRDLLGYSNIEIAEMMGLKDNRIRVGLFRARQKIRNKLKQLINYGLE